MQTLQSPATAEEWLQLTDRLGRRFADRAAEYDRTDTFVRENYADLKEHRFFSAMIPEELGGGGAPHSLVCRLLKKIAHYDSSTALALSMHQHLVAANVWKYRKGQGGEEVLRKVAGRQLVLVSTGARDWLESNGTMEKVDGGYLLSAQKHFASQSVVGDLLVTSAPFADPERGRQVLHFAVPLQAEGVSLLDNWYTLGMRGTGSQTVVLDKVFVPESAIVLARPQGEYHPVWNVVLTVAMPLIMSAYAGVAERAARVALDLVKGKGAAEPHLPFLAGEMHNELTAAQVLLDDMIRLANDLDFQPADETARAILSRKTLVAGAAIRTVAKSMELVGGRSYFRSQELERLFRDVQAAAFHPLPEKEQQKFVGDFLLMEQEGWKSGTK